jgi:hypothetical protein
MKSKVFLDVTLGVQRQPEVLEEYIASIFRIEE